MATCPAIFAAVLHNKCPPKRQSFVLKIQASPCLPLVYINPKVEFPCKSLGVFFWLVEPPPKKKLLFWSKLLQNSKSSWTFALMFFQQTVISLMCFSRSFLKHATPSFSEYQWKAVNIISTAQLSKPAQGQRPQKFRKIQDEKFRGFKGPARWAEWGFIYNSHKLGWNNPSFYPYSFNYIYKDIYRGYQISPRLWRSAGGPPHQPGWH